MNSRRYLIGSAFWTAIQAAPELAGILFERNPRVAADISEGDRLVFFRDVRDGFIDKKNGTGTRAFSFQVGAINRNENADSGADEDYEAARVAVEKAFESIGLEFDLGPLTEDGVEYEVDDIDIDGAKVVGSFTVEYLQQRVAF